MKFSWHVPLKLLGKLMVELLIGVSCVALANNIIPLGTHENNLYYKMGGGSDFTLPPVSDTTTMTLNAGADLSAGLSCGAFNPALSITNSMNNLKDEVDNLEQGIIAAATGSIAEMPMYELAKADPTLYHLLNNALLSAHKQIDLSVKGCQQVRNEIAHGKNPYADWAILSVGDRWKQHLALTAAGDEDINDAEQDVNEHAGDNGVTWVQGSEGVDGALHAGGQNQPPIHVIADTVMAGYNALLNRANLQDPSPAPTGTELSQAFPAPSDAVSWTTNVVGDAIITTCNDTTCKNNQGGLAGRGLLPWITTCHLPNQPDCTQTIQTNLANLVTAQTPITQENLDSVSAEDLIISPHVIHALQNMEPTQQKLLISKLAQEVATQRVVEKALLAKTLLQTGSQVPVIAANQPAQKTIQAATSHLNQDIQSLAFEASIRKQLLSNTLEDLMNYQQQQQTATQQTQVTVSPLLLQNSALTTSQEALIK